MLEIVGTPLIVEANTITIPSGHQPGDLIWIGAFRDGSATNPTIGAGFTNQTNTFDGTTCSVSAGWKIATSAAETSGTWTNASALACIVFRNVRAQGTPLGTSTNTAATGATLNYGAVTLNRPAYLLAIAFHRSVDTTTLTTPPSGLGLLASNLGAVCDAALFGGFIASGDYAANTVAHGGTNSGNQTMVFEIRAAEMQFNNYLHASAGSGISVTEKIR